MRIVIGLLPALAAVALLLTADTRRGTLAPYPADAPRWHVPGTPPPGLPWGGCPRTKPSSQEFFDLELPEAHHAQGEFDRLHVPAGLDVPADRVYSAARSPHMITFTVAASGMVRFRGFVFDLANVDPGEKRETERALGSIIGRMTKAADPPYDRIQGVFDRGARWGDVRTCLWATLRQGPKCPLEMRVRSDSRHRVRYMRLRLQRRGWDEAIWGFDSPEGAVSLAQTAADEGWELPPDPPCIHLARVGTGKEAYTRLRYAGQTLEFPSSDNFEDAAFVRSANATWATFAQMTAAQGHEPFATLLLDDGVDVPWAYVLGVVDVLAGQGVTRLNLPSVSTWEPGLPVRSDNGVLSPAPAPRGKMLAWVWGLVIEVLPLPKPLPTPHCRASPQDGPHPLWLGLAVATASVLALFIPSRPRRRAEER